MNDRMATRRVLRLEQLEPRQLLASDCVGGALDAMFAARFARRFYQPDLAGNSTDNAYELGTIDDSRQLHGRVGWRDTADVFQFQVDQTAVVDVAVGQLFGTVDWRVLNDTGDVLYDSHARRTAIPLELDADTYFIEVTPGDLFFNRYRLRIDVSTPTDVPSTTRPPVPIPTRPTPTESPTPSTSPPGVVDATPQPVQPLTDVAYFGGSLDWNLNAINAPESWNQGYDGTGVTVAVIDTGVDTRHSDLDGNIWVNSDEVAHDGIDNDGNGYVDDLVGWNFVEDNPNVFDTQGHGTHVAGTIAAEWNGSGATGVAHGASIMPIRVLGDDGSGYSFDIATGIRYAVDNGADVINLSLGGGYSSSIYAALQYADRHDVFVAIASGNAGSSQPSYPALHSGALDNVLSVGAYDSRLRMAGFSNQAGNTAVQVDAPGVSIYSTLPNDRFGRYSGTSMAAPHVAGLAALALSADASLSADQLRDLLVAGAHTEIIASTSQGVDAAYSVAYAAAGYASGSVSLAELAVATQTSDARRTSQQNTPVYPAPRLAPTPRNVEAQDNSTVRAAGTHPEPDSHVTSVETAPRSTTAQVGLRPDNASAQSARRTATDARDQDASHALDTNLG